MNQAVDMYEQLKAKGLVTALVLFEGEQHGFRGTSAIRSVVAHHSRRLSEKEKGCMLWDVALPTRPPSDSSNCTPGKRERAIAEKQRKEIQGTISDTEWQIPLCQHGLLQTIV